MPNVLILFAHPRFEQSRAQAALVRNLPKDPRVTFRDLYEIYPDFQIDIPLEQKILSEHDIIIWQHPLYWYSAPPLIKQWIDLVLEFGWAYGPGANALEGKWIFNAFSSGGGRDRYSPGGRNRYTIPEFLRPFEQTSWLCKMRYLPPYALMGTHRFSKSTCDSFGQEYGHMVRLLIEGVLDPEEWAAHEFANDYLERFKVEQQ
ncbi:MAG: NAD(P)H-dependent oxidoreductase [Bacteroidota bacterium]